MENTQEKFRTLSNCLACGSDELHEYLDLGDQPLANALETMTSRGEKFPLKANYCSRCAHSQLSIAVNPDLLFKDYKYVSGTTETLGKHFDWLSGRLSGYFYDRLSYEDHFENFIGPLDILDIGSNDGSLLKQFKARGHNVLGVDPAKDIADQATADGIPTVNNYWPIDLTQKFDIITGLNVFAHNLNPKEFLLGCSRHLKNGGIIAIEMPYSLSTIAEVQYTQYYHEHVNYFTVSSMVSLATRCRLSIVDIIESDVHGGSICFILQPALNPVHEYAVDGYMEDERRAGLYELETYKRFAELTELNTIILSNFLNDEYEHETDIVGYGAAAKTTVTINYMKHLGLSGWENIRCVLDDNPRKAGYFIPGTSIEIFETKYGWIYHSLLVNFAFNFQEEIKRRLGDRWKRIRIVRNIPNLQVEWII